MTFTYVPNGVCSSKYTFEIDDDTVKSLKIEGGCPGNLLGISKIVVGMKCEDIIKAFEGTDCRGKGTSCPDQISKALRQYLNNK